MKNLVKQTVAAAFLTLFIMVVMVNANGTELKVSGPEVIETELQLDNWMTDESIWNTNSFNNLSVWQVGEIELELEDWMTNETIWKANSIYSVFVLQASETELDVEDWMTNEDIWDLQDIAIDKELELENWMFSDNIWK